MTNTRNNSSGVPGFVMYTGDNGNTSDIVIPMVELADENWQLLVPNLNSSVDLRVIVTAEGTPKSSEHGQNHKLKQKFNIC